MKPAETALAPGRNQPGLFNAHVELRRLLLGKTVPPFTPIQEFELMRWAKFRAQFNENLSDVCRLSASESTAEASGTVSAVSHTTQE